MVFFFAVGWRSSENSRWASSPTAAMPAFAAFTGLALPADLLCHAGAIGLDTGWFSDDLAFGAHAARVQEDTLSAAASGAGGTPTFFVNGRRQKGPTNSDSLTEALLAKLETLQAPPLS